MSFDPYANHGANLMNSARKVIAITPSDEDDLPQVCKALRIYNSSANPKSIRYITVAASDVTVTVPPGLSIESAVVVAVRATDSDVSDLEIFGYTD